MNKSIPKEKVAAYPAFFDKWFTKKLPKYDESHYKTETYITQRQIEFFLYTIEFI
ncbi:hypothetical protein GCM10007877_36360 [Marinibactrum halimedae]|uniref:Uncharacterized protein n=1 Tax=Marinibactrum halimedae TaxID=1444977 RepID=A0AA37TAH3_9GAMM|nr:hypothetical protein GCM10007877_36360 [Marinibactrum halimedae]